jgi:hypothetical protein
VQAVVESLRQNHQLDTMANGHDESQGSQAQRVRHTAQRRPGGYNAPHPSERGNAEVSGSNARCINLTKTNKIT